MRGKPPASRDGPRGRVYFCHIWWDKHEETEAFVEAFDRLKKDGKVRAVGVSTNDLDHIKHFDRDGGLDVVQLDYSILNRVPEREVLPYLEERGIKVVRGPLRMGILTGKFSEETTFPEGDIRDDWPQERWFEESLRKVERLRPLADERTLGQLALRYVLGHEAVSVAIHVAKSPSRWRRTRRHPCAPPLRGGPPTHPRGRATLTLSLY